MELQAIKRHKNEILKTRIRPPNTWIRPPNLLPVLSLQLRLKSATEFAKCATLFVDIDHWILEHGGRISKVYKYKSVFSD